MPQCWRSPSICSLGLGYQVTAATNAAEALGDHAVGGVAIDILFSDVVMPGGVSGVSLARTARELRPDIKVLLTSGFVGDGAVLETAEFPLLDKPYETSQLAAKLRTILVRRAPRVGDAGTGLGAPREVGLGRRAAE